METVPFINSKISDVIRVGTTTGDKFGIELELEGRNVGLADVATKGWRRTHDGSLRGESIEFVTAGPKTFEEITALVDCLFKKFTEHKVKFNDSVRTSTHVHLNFSDKTVRNVINFFTLFALVEEVLQYYSGEDRKGNLFCISCREAEGIIQVLSKALAKGDFYSFAGDRYKYSACNLSTLYKFGTIEVRTMKGATSAKQINKWVEILNALNKYALKLNSPAELVTDLSLLGAEALMRRIFGEELFRELMTTFPAIQTLHYSLMEGARVIQMLAFEYDEAFKTKYDPPPAEVVKQKKHPVVRGEPARREGFLPRQDNLIIWRPDGMRWICSPPHGQDGWNDGDRVRDHDQIRWSADHQRFYVVLDNGRPYYCNWHNHPVIVNEGRPIERQAMPIRRFDFVEGEREEEPEDEPDWDEEGDADF